METKIIAPPVGWCVLLLAGVDIVLAFGLVGGALGLGAILIDRREKRK